jgi:hypothetical protein
MMRSARKAAPFIVFYLLTSTATAHAQCAWVLWEHRTTPEREIWTLVQAHADLQECEKQRAALVNPGSAWRVGFPRNLEWGRVGSENMAFAGTKRVVCVPGTLDPRPSADPSRLAPQPPLFTPAPPASPTPPTR